MTSKPKSHAFRVAAAHLAIRASSSAARRSDTGSLVQMAQWGADGADDGTVGEKAASREEAVTVVGLPEKPAASWLPAGGP